MALTRLSAVTAPSIALSPVSGTLEWVARPTISTSTRPQLPRERAKPVPIRIMPNAGRGCSARRIASEQAWLLRPSLLIAR